MYKLEVGVGARDASPGTGRLGSSRRSKPWCTSPKWRRNRPQRCSVWSHLPESDPATPSLPSMRRGFTPPCMTSRYHTTAQVRGAAEDRVARRREVARSAVSGKSLARGPLRELELDRAGTRAPAPGLADGCDRGRGQRAIRVGHPGPPGGRALSDLRHGWPAAASTGRWAGRPRNSIRARTTRRARVRPRTTLPVGRPQNTRARQARVTAPMRRARLLAPTQTPTGPGAQAGVLGAALQPGDRAGQALAGAYRGDRPAGEERPGSDH